MRDIEVSDGGVSGGGQSLNFANWPSLLLTPGPEAHPAQGVVSVRYSLVTTAIGEPALRS